MRLVKVKWREFQSTDLQIGIRYQIGFHSIKEISTKDTGIEGIEDLSSDYTPIILTVSQTVIRNKNLLHQ